METSDSVQGNIEEIARDGSDEEDIVELDAASPRGLQPQDGLASSEQRQPVMERDWEAGYRGCPKFGPKLR